MGIVSKVPNYVKVLVFLALLVLLGNLLSNYGEDRFEQGYNHAETIYLKKASDDKALSDRALNERIEALRALLETTELEYQSQQARAVELQKLLDNKPEVKREIKYVKVDDCVNLGDDFTGMFQRIIIEAKPDITHR